MPPKAAKKGSAKKPNASGAAAVGKNWEAGLARAQFEEESWQACVSLVVGRSPEEEKLTQALSGSVQKPQRKLFSSLTWDSTVAKIHELGNPKAKRPDDAPMFYEVTEPAKVLLDAGEEIPCDLMANILKFQLLQIKAYDQQRRKAEQAEEEKADAGPPSVNKDKGGTKVSDKKGKNPPSPVGPSKEKKTKLKRRDDVEPPKYIDDEPEDGPQHYNLLLGFFQPNLIVALDAIGVHVANVIKLCSEHTQTSEEQQEKRPCGGNEQTTSPVLDSAEVHGCAELDLFWSGLRPVLDSGPPESKLHDVVQLSYTAPELRPTSHTQDPEAELEMGNQVFEGVANLIYDSLNWRRQHQHYLDNIKFFSVPTVVVLDAEPAEVVPTPLPVTPRSKKKSVREESPPDQETEQPPLSTDVDTRCYSSLLNLVPPEACSVALIMHCMLEQVVISTEQSSPSKESKPHNGPCLDYQLVSFMLQSFLSLVHAKEERSHMLKGLLTTVQNEDYQKRLEEKFGEEGKEKQKKFVHPLVIRHHDERALRLTNISAVQGFDPAEVETSMMRFSPVWQLIHSVAQPRNSNSSWKAIKQQLQHYCTDDVVSWLEVERLVHQSVFESMPLTRLDSKGVLLKPPGTLGPAQEQMTTSIPWDNPLSYSKQQLNTLQTKGLTFLTEDPGNMKKTRRVCCHLDLCDIQSCRLRSLYDWHYAEHHSASIFPQVLQSASQDYCCLDTFRGSHNHILYIFCHNPMSPYRQCKEIWEVALHTDIKFRKYVEHVAGSISDWTKAEELKREAMQLQNVRPAQDLEDEKATDSAEREDTLELVIRKGSLKAQKLEQEQLKEEEMTKKSKKENAPKGKQQKEEAMSTDNKKSNTLPSGKKSRAGSSARTLIESNNTTAPPLEENKALHTSEEPFKGFTGYSMEGKLIRVAGRLHYLFPSDGGHITVENISFVEGSILMKLAVKKDGHYFCTHINQIVVDPVKPLPQPQDKETNGRKDDFKVSEPVQPVRRVKQGSLSAVLDNGIHLSYSFYGPTGEYRVSPQESTEGGAPDSTSFVPNCPPSSTYCSKGTDLDSVPSKKHSPASHTRPPLSQSKVCEGRTVLPSSPFNSLSLSVPNGLLLQFLREDAPGVSSEEQGMLVKQSFPLHGEGVVGQLQDASLSKELSRIVTSQGAVIRIMRDGSTEVLFADGSVSFSQDSGPVWVPDSEVEEETKDRKKGLSSEEEAGFWLTTTPSGRRIYTVGTTHQHKPATPLLAFEATDPFTHEVMLSREDLVVSVQNPDGSLSVEHADGTRITSLYQNRPPSTPQHTLPHTLPHTGEQHETLTSTSESECVCVTQRADCICENIQDAVDNSEDISSDSATIACDKEGGSECELVCDERESSVHKNGEERVFAKDTVDGNFKRRACDSNKGSVSAKERVVLVEKEGCSSVVMYPERHTAHVILADGSVITGNNQGAYEVFPSSGGLLLIQSDGKCVYSPDPLVTPSPKGGTPTNQSGSYTMSHTDTVACDVTDPDGNHFQVMEDGQVSVLNYSPAPSTPKEDEKEEEEEEEEEEEDREMVRIHVKHREHCPRLFMAHEDGSGAELLSSQTVEELLYQAYSDPTIALLKEPLPDTQDEFGITILKPIHPSVWSQWLLEKQNPDITPPNLKNRSWHDFPQTERKTPGPLLGTHIGQGLFLRERSAGSAAQRPPARSCPKVLETRELYQHRPFTMPLRNTLDSRLKEYIESLMESEQRSEEMKVKEPRTEEEIGHASDLLNLVLSFAEQEDGGHTFDKRTSEDLANLYSQGVRVPVEQSDVSEDTVTVASESFTNGRESKWTERLAQHRQEKCEEEAYRMSLRTKNIAPFFHPENIQLYQELLQHQTPDMRSLSMDLPPIPPSDSAEDFLKDAPQENTPRRPLNPTPSQSASHAAGSERMLKKRPTNPTPHGAGESSVRGSPGQSKSVQLDVTGQLRRTKIRLPSSILTSKARSIPNQQFLSVEEPVRRKCRTISLTDPSVIARGFQLLPSTVDFGTLQEGTSSAITVVMKNVGVDTCRFHVKQPPAATGFRVIYNPGPVAAGLHVELQVQLFAMCAVQAGEVEPKKNLSEDIIIHTETDILYLPVTATILPERLYDVWLKGHSSTNNKKSLGVRQLSASLPVRRGAAQLHRPAGNLFTSPSANKGHLNRTTPM
ncbi:sperm-associated antigen 17 [Eleginops maclovinus]|uniref:sperm-associated antigen 17 n=1 Tax=Eleginops maclovinus TaxID=56733 RepID=UPI003080F252